MDEIELAKAELQLARAKVELGHQIPDFLPEITDDSGKRIKLQRMTLEELQSVPFVPGKTMEEIQEEQLRSSTKTQGTSKRGYHAAHNHTTEKQLPVPDSLMDDGLVPGEFDPQDVVRVDTRPYSNSSKSAASTKPSVAINDEELVTVYQKKGSKRASQESHGHSHAHQHGESCSHDHGHDHGHSHSEGGPVTRGASRGTRMTVNRYRHFLRAVIIFIQCTHYGFEIFYIAPKFKNPFNTWLLQVFVAILWLVTTYSHLQVSLTPSKSFDRVKQDPEELKGPDEYKVCTKCSKPTWKPARTSHCSVQGFDVLRFDHYCPVTLNTVGYRTHGAFLITAYCHMIGGITWGILLPIYILANWKELMPRQLGRILIVLILVLIDYFTILSIMGMACGISFQHTSLVLNHATTLEGGNSFGVFAPDRRKGSYNLTVLYNLRQYFTNDFWCFLLQGRYEGNKYEGYWFPRVGETREKFAFSAEINNSHMVNGTKLEVPPDGVEMVGRMLYDNHRMIYPAYTEPASSVVEQRETLATEEDL